MNRSAAGRTTSGCIREPETKSYARKSSHTASFTKNKMPNITWKSYGSCAGSLIQRTDEIVQSSDMAPQAGWHPLCQRIGHQNQRACARALSCPNDEYP